MECCHPSYFGMESLHSVASITLPSLMHSCSSIPAQPVVGTGTVLYWTNKGLVAQHVDGIPKVAGWVSASDGVTQHQQSLSMIHQLHQNRRGLPVTGVLELEPSMTWNPQTVAGIGAVTNPTQLHKDMHAYLAGGCQAPPQDACLGPKHLNRYLR